MSIISCHVFFSHVLEMKRVTARLIPKLLNFEQRQRRISIAQKFLKDINDDPDLLKKVITVDETWVYG